MAEAIQHPSAAKIPRKIEEKIRCGESTCRSEMLKRNLKSHFERKHPGVEPYEYKMEEEEGEGRRLLSDLQRRLRTMPRIENPTNKQPDYMKEILLKLEKLEVGQQKLDVGQEKILRTVESEEDRIRRTKRDAVEEKIQQQIKAVKSSRTVQEITQNATFDSTAEGLNCRSCKSRKGFGFFSYKDDEDPEKKQRFYDLKKSITVHLASERHISLDMEQDKIAEEFRERNYKVGMLLGRNAYKANLDASFTSYERLVAKDHVAGLDVGDKNHSRAFSEAMGKAFEDTLRQELKSQSAEIMKGTGRASPFTLIADTYSSDRTCVNMVASNIILDNTVKTIYLDSRIVHDRTGSGIAKQLYEVMEDSFGKDRVKEGYTGVCGDGAMLHTNFWKELNERISDTKEGVGSYSNLWDAGHNLQLGEADAKTKFQGNEWVQDMEGVVNELHKKVGYGKAYDSISMKAKEEGSKVQSPRLFSTTRWASYAHGVYKSNNANFQYIYDHLNEKGEDLLDKMNHIDHIVKLNGLQDLYKETEKLSKTLQIPDITLWQGKEALEEYQKNLKIASDALISGDPTAIKKVIDENGSHILKNTLTAVEELELKGEYKGKVILTNQNRSVGQTTRRFHEAANDDSETREKIKKSLEKVGNYAKDLQQAIGNRFQNAEREIDQEVQKLFSVKEIISRDDIPKRELKSYYEKNFAEGNLHGTTYESFKRQYRNFSSDVKINLKGFNNATTSERRKQEKDFYHKVLSGKVGKYEDVAYHGAKAILRLPNEGQIEAIGSVIKRHAHTRGSLEIPKLSREVFLAHNGPTEYNKNADILIEKSLKAKYGSDPSKWSFINKSDGRKLKKFHPSKVVERLINAPPRLTMKDEHIEENKQIEQNREVDEEDHDVEGERQEMEESSDSEVQLDSDSEEEVSFYGASSSSEEERNYSDREEIQEQEKENDFRMEISESESEEEGEGGEGGGGGGRGGGGGGGRGGGGGGRGGFGGGGWGGSQSMGANRNRTNFMRGDWPA